MGDIKALPQFGTILKYLNSVAPCEKVDYLDGWMLGWVDGWMGGR
jgi:hypothetical protein